MNGLFCPTCRIDKHKPLYAQDGLYICEKCGGIVGYFCRGCDKVYTENRLGRRGDEWRCKICDTIQWGYTEYKRREMNIPL